MPHTEIHMKTPAQWRKDIERSLKYRKDRDDEAARFQRAYTGDYNTNPRKGLDKNKDEMYVNFVFSYVETIAPTVFSGDVRCVAQAENAESEATAEHIQAVVNYWNRKLGLRDDFMLCRWDAFWGNCYALSEWLYEEVEEEVPAIANVDPYTGLPVMGKPTKEIRVIKDQPFVKRLDPRDVVLDPDSKCRKEDRWRGYRMILTMEEFQRMDFSSRLKKNASPEAMPRDATRLGGDQDQGTDQEWVILWKIYDLANEKIIILRDRGDDGMDSVEETDWPYEFEVEQDRFPITVLEGKPDAENPYAFSEFKAFWAQIQERNKIRTTIQSTTRRQKPKYLAKKNANDEDQLNKFTNAAIGEVVTMNQPEAIMVSPQHELPAEVYNFDRMSGDDLVNTSGFYEYNNDSIADTATEASLLNARGNIRKSERKQAFERFIARVDAKIAQLCQQYMDEAVAIQIKKPEDPRALMWLRASKEEIQGEFSWIIKPGIMANKDEGLRRQQILKFAELMASNPHVDQRLLAEDLAETFDYDSDRILRPLKEVKDEQQAMQMAQQKPPAEEKPMIQFSDIKWETLPPEIQAMVLQSAMKQNDVPPGENGGPGNAQPAAPSLAPPAMNSVMPGASMNQGPIPLAGGMEPPATPVMPASEMQGGPQ